MTFRQINYSVDFCVIGGGMSGLCAAMAAARHGASVVLMHDRPVLGGNASSECRIHICGADRHNQILNLRETGLLEELRLENLARNPNKNYSIWDTILYEKALAEPNLRLLLNCSCLDIEMDANTIQTVKGWQLTTQTYFKIQAKIFADCSGDAVLAPLSGARYRMGREARNEYGESIAPEVADEYTMGMTCLFQSRLYPTPQPFSPLPWAYQYSRCEDLPYGADGHHWWQMGYWWVELGGEASAIHDTEALRDELLKVTFGIWDHLKNKCPYRNEAANWAIDWIQFLPAKRESRRYIGEYVLNQKDIESGGRFADTVAYGGWTMDDHHPAGFKAVQIGYPATIFHHAPSPYGIPYRSLYSRDISNLMFAGRNASCTHTAMSSTRVMGTGCSMGQAVGTAAALSVKKGIQPRVLGNNIEELQQLLLRDDAYLPEVKLSLPPIITTSLLRASKGDPEPIRDGTNRPVGNNPHAWKCQIGDWVSYQFKESISVKTITFILDSALEKNIAMSYHQQDDQLTHPPAQLPRDFLIEGLTGESWFTIQQVNDNHQRLVVSLCNQQLDGIRFTLKKTWGSQSTQLFLFSVS